MKSHVFVIGCILVSLSSHAWRAQAQSWSDNFESYPLGSFPSPNWQPSGNNGTSIVNSTYVSPHQSVQMYGIVGGCWAALIHRQLRVTPPYTIQFYARNGNESLSGCHPIRASVGLNTGPSWTTPGRLLSTFGANGDFLTDWPSVSVGPAFPLLTWVKVQITYEFLNANTVRIGYWLNDQFYKSVLSTPSASEGQFAWLSLASNEGTSWFDDVSITPGLLYPACTLKDTATYNATTSTLTMKFTVGNNLGTSANWSAWLTYADPQGTALDTMQTLFSVSQPITNPPKAITKTFTGLPKEGKVGVLSTLSTPHLSTAKTEGIACSSWVQINTGSEP
jgi:hypothetical protein